MGNAVRIREGALSIRGGALLLVAMGLALLITNGVAHAAPANDNFANAQRITGAQATLTGTSVDATKENGEPNHANNAGGKSVWYTWQAPSTGTVTIDTSGSTFDTLLAVYTGNAVGSLTEVASNDEDPSSPASTSKVQSVQVTAGTTYRIAVDGYKSFGDADSGSITLNLATYTPPPENDAFANAQQVTGTNATVTGTSAGATKEGGEPNHAGNVGGKSVWYRWTPQSSGPVTISTAGSTFDTLLAVYTGNAVGSLTEVASNDEDTANQLSTSKLESVQVTAGTTYRIAVDGYKGFEDTASGSITLNLAPSAGAPENDNFANAQRITGTNATLTGTNVDATKENGEPNHANEVGGKSVWYHWTPEQSGTAAIDTFGSDFDTLLAVYTGGAVSSLSPVASNDEAPEGGRQSKVIFAASAGTTYRVAVDGYNDNVVGAESGSVTLNLASSTPDTTAPGAPVITNPADNSFDTDGNVTLSGTAEADATIELFEVATSGNVSKGTTQADSTGAWSKTLNAVPDGSHTYTATATDAAGNASAESEARTVKVDTIAPTVEDWTPIGKKVRPTAKPTVTFSEAMGKGSVEAADANGLPTAIVLKKGSVQVAATVVLDASGERATLTPARALKRGATYTVTVTGAAEDVAGNALDQDPSLLGEQPKVWKFAIKR